MKGIIKNRERVAINKVLMFVPSSLVNISALDLGSSKEARGKTLN